jgi:hypothetical protein
LASFFHEALSQGSLPIWNDRIGMGMPLYASGQIGAFYPPNWLIYQLPPIQALEVSRVAHLTLAGVGAGLIVLRLSGSRAGALTTAVIAVLAGGIMAKLDWADMVTVYGWMPWVLLPLLWRRPGPSWRGVLLAGAAWGIQALCGHPPYWILTGVAAAVVLVAQLPNLRGLVKAVGFGIAGVGVGAVQLIPSVLMLSLSTRVQGFSPTGVSEFSATPLDFLGLAFANVFEPAASPAWDLTQTWYPGWYWGFLEAYAYVGLPALALAMIGARSRRGRAILALAIAAIAIPVIGDVLPGVWAAIPVLNGLRHPVRAYVVLDLALAIAAGLGVARLGRARSLRLSTFVVALAVGGYGLIAAFVLLLPGTFQDLVAAAWPQPVNPATLRTLATTALTRWWPLGFELLLAALILLVLRVKGRRPAVRLAAVALVAIPLAILVPGINESLPASAFSLDGSGLVGAIRAESPRGVLAIHQPYSGGLGDVLQRAGAEREPNTYGTEFFAALSLKASDDLVRQLELKPDTQLTRAVGVDTIVSFGTPCFGRPVAFEKQTNAYVCRLDDATRPPYWMPANSVVISPLLIGSPISPIAANVDPAKAVRGAVSASVLSWNAGSAEILVDAPASGFVFINRSWWPGWQVTLDGDPVTPYSALGGQLVPVSAGQHTVDEQMVPWDAAIGAVISGSSLLLIGAWLVIARRRSSSRGSSHSTAPMSPAPELPT